MTSSRPTESIFESPLSRLANDGAKWLLGGGIVAIIVGALALVWPGPTVLVLAIFFGAYLLVSGITQLVGAFAPNQATSAHILGAISGVLSIALGVICFRDIFQSVVLLAVWIGIGWIFAGTTQLIGALSAPAMTGRGWAITLAIIVTIGGVVLITSPLSSILALAITAGAFLIATGLVQVITAVRVRHTA